MIATQKKSKRLKYLEDIVSCYLDPVEIIKQNGRHLFIYNCSRCKRPLRKRAKASVLFMMRECAKCTQRTFQEVLSSENFVYGCSRVVLGL